MRKHFRSTTSRLLAAAAGSALAAALVLANPFPVSVHGQTVPSTTVSPAGSTVAAPGVAVLPLTSAPASTGSPEPVVAPVTAASPITTASPATGAAPVVSSRSQATIVTQQPTALPRTGTGFAADTGMNATVLYALLALAAALGSVAILVRRAR